MQSLTARGVALVSLVLSMLFGLLANPVPVGAVPPSITSLRTDGRTIVWQYQYYTSRLMVRSIGSNTDRQIADNAMFPDVSGDRVVWETGSPDGSKLAGVNLADDSSLNLPNDTGQQMSPSIDGDRLVWVNQTTSDSTKSWTIMADDLSSNQAPQVVAKLPTDMTYVGRPEISGSFVIWSLQYGGQGSSDQHWELWDATIGGGAHQIASGAGATDNLLGYDVGGMYVVYATANGVRLINIGSPVVDRILGQGYNPTTDGRYVFWTSTVSGTRQDIVGYDASTDSTFVAVGNGNTNSLPWTANGVLGWVESAMYLSSPSVKSSALSALLPSASQPNPDTTSPNWFYFPETSHYLSFGFKNFWTKSGGLPLFGYPLTEEFSQGGDTVQYLERQRFEYHPELVGTPYATELGLLGTEAVQAAGLLTSAPFQPRPATTSTDANCTYVAATGHRLCASFRQYWQTHGLDFGDPGVSYRESLALFGYPISEEFTDSGTGLTVQYFERAVFEYHPNNPQPYKVELRLLGSERLQSFGW